MKVAHVVPSFVLAAGLLLLAPGGAAATTAAVQPRRCARATQLSLGLGLRIDGDLRGVVGPTVTLSHNLGPRLALDGQLLWGSAQGPLFSSLHGLGAQAQLGVRWIWFEGVFSPYLGARGGATLTHFDPTDEIGGLFDPPTVEDARKEARDESGLSLQGLAVAGLDLSLRSGLTFGVEVQVGAATPRGDERDALLTVGSNLWLGARF